MIEKILSTVNMARTALFTTLVCVVTIVFSIYVPETRGFFNIGDSMVFISAIFFGPFVGAFAGGVGSMIADLLLGYPYYAPATLVIKACEGAVVGLLNERGGDDWSIKNWKVFTIALSVILGLALGYFGITYYSGQVEITVGSSLFELFVPQEFWIISSIAITLLIGSLGFLTEPKLGWTIISVIAGGFIMVSGYFVFQQFVIGPLFNIEVVAIAEIPINIGQMIVGAVIALSITKIVGRGHPFLKSK